MVFLQFRGTWSSNHVNQIPVCDLRRSTRLDNPVLAAGVLLSYLRAVIQPQEGPQALQAPEGRFRAANIEIHDNKLAENVEFPSGQNYVHDLLYKRS